MNQPTPYKGNKPYIFISYSHRDSCRVWPIIKRMQHDGYRVWYDAGVVPGTEWDDYIAEQVEQCGCFIALLSANYLASDNCKDELKYSRDLGKPQLLIYLEDVKLSGGMAMRLNRLQAIYWHYYSNMDDACAQLYQTRELGRCCAGKKSMRALPVIKEAGLRGDVEPVAARCPSVKTDDYSNSTVSKYRESPPVKIDSQDDFLNNDCSVPSDEFKKITNYFFRNLSSQGFFDFEADCSKNEKSINLIMHKTHYRYEVRLNAVDSTIWSNVVQKAFSVALENIVKTGITSEKYTADNIVSKLTIAGFVGIKTMASEEAITVIGTFEDRRISVKFARKNISEQIERWRRSAADKAKQTGIYREIDPRYTTR